MVHFFFFKRRLKHFLISILLPIINITLHANNSLQFIPLTASSLPTNEVRNLYQDREGYIWISTYNGLLRFDGYSSVVYRPNGIDPKHNINGFVNIVAEDNNHKLWIGTNSGLYVLDKRQGTIEKVISPLLQVSHIEALTCTSKGEIWVGANKGIFRKKAESNTFELCDPKIQETNQPHFDVKSIIEDANGHIWIGTWEQGLLRYNPESDQFYTYKNLNPSQSAHTLFQDNKGNIWIGTWRYGLLKMENPYDMNHYKLTCFKHEKEREESLCDNIIYTITQDRNTGKLWIGTRSGLSILESEAGKGTFTNYLPNQGKSPLPFNEVDALLYSRDGLMWIGMLGGGVYTANTRKKLFDYDPITPLLKQFPSSSVRSVYPAGEQSLYMGIMGYGLIEYNTEKQEIIHYKQHPVFKHLPYISTVNDIIRRSDGSFCFATWDDGIWLYNGKETKVINTQTHPALTDVCIYSLLEDERGNLWIGTRAGLCMLDPAGKMRTIDMLIPNEKHAWAQVPIFKIIEDKNHDIWIATPNNGIWRITFDGNKYHGKIYVASHGNSQSVGAMTMCADSKNQIWAGTNGNGLDLYDEKNDCFQSVLNDQFEQGDVVFSMIEDNTQGLWLTTNTKMYHIDINHIDAAHIHTYTMEEGLQDHIFNRNVCFKKEDGTLYFGGARGLNSFHPDQIGYDSISYPVVITDLRIHNTSIQHLSPVEVNKILNAPLDYASHIVLPYDKNNFSLDFSILSYINPLLNKFKYQLEGYDNQWISTNARRHFAYYNNLPAGDYLFKVKGANQNGNWSDRERSIRITVLPPPWLSWWAYCLYILVAIGIITYLYFTIRKRILMSRAIELGKLQRQKLEEVNHAKLQFFTNITHELLTPLSVIQASVEELNLQYPRMKSQLRGISDNSMRLIRLIQQILEFRKVENAKQQLRVSEGNVTLFIKRSVIAFAPLVRKKKLNIVLEDFNTAYTGYFDSDKLDKILYNLLSNAAKYTLEGGTITLKQRYDNSDGHYTFSVNNPGAPIPEDKLEHLFERFYEGEYRKFHTIGTGIGLSLTKDLIKLHHGHIHVTSNQEQGTTFTVELPLGRNYFSNTEVDDTLNNYIDDEVETSEAEETDTPTEEDNKFPVTPNHDIRILLAEDNEELRNSMAKMLSRHFFVIEAKDGQDAWEKIRKGRINLIVSDIMMPRISGIELCKQVKATFETAHIPVILITARISDTDRVEGYDAGADGYICKPLKMSILNAKINNLLKKQESGKNNDARKKLVFEAKEVDYTPQDEEFLKKALDIVNRHLDDQQFDTTLFTNEMGMARTTFNEKMKQLAGVTPAVFISNVRLQAAFKLIQEKKKIRISELAYSVGFNDPKYFSLCFRKKFGLSPKDMKSEGEKTNEE